MNVAAAPTIKVTSLTDLAKKTKRILGAEKPGVVELAAWLNQMDVVMQVASIVDPNGEQMAQSQIGLNVIVAARAIRFGTPDLEMFAPAVQELAAAIAPTVTKHGWPHGRYVRQIAAGNIGCVASL